MKEINASGIIVECRGKILLLKRSMRDSYSGKWCLPGGSVEENETYFDAAIRELREETGLFVDTLEDLGFHNYEEQEKHINFRVFRIVFKDRPVVFINNEHSDYLWVSYDAALQLKDLLFRDNFEKLVLKVKNNFTFTK